MEKQYQNWYLQHTSTDHTVLNCIGTGTTIIVPPVNIIHYGTTGTRTHTKFSTGSNMVCGVVDGTGHGPVVLILGSDLVGWQKVTCGLLTKTTVQY